MLRTLALSALLLVVLAPSAHARSRTDNLESHIAELNRVLKRVYEQTDGDARRKQRRVKWGQYFSVDDARTRLQYGSYKTPAYLQIPFDAPWTISVGPSAVPKGRFMARLKVGKARMTSGMAGDRRQARSSYAFVVLTEADARRVADLLRRIQAGAGDDGPGDASAARRAPPDHGQSAAAGRVPAFRTAVSPLNGTHTGEPVEITVQATPGSWLTAFAENDGPRKMFQAVYIEAPDGKLTGGKKAIDAATGALRFGHIARTPTGAGGAFTIRIVPLRDSRGPFYFEGRIVHPTRRSRPEQDLCDGLDLLMAHIDDGLGHLVETDPTKPGMRPVPLTLAGGIQGQAAAGHTWIARVFRGAKRGGQRRLEALGRELDVCLGAGRAGEVKRAGWADHTQRSWVRGDVHVRLRLYRKQREATLELAVYKGEGPL